MSPRPWREIAADPAFESLSIEGQAKAQRLYFERHLRPLAEREGRDPDSVWQEFTRRYFYPVSPKVDNPLGLPSGPSFSSPGEQRAAEIRGEIPDPAERDWSLRGIPGETKKTPQALFGLAGAAIRERAEAPERDRQLVEWWGRMSESDKRGLLAGLDSPAGSATRVLAEQARRASHLASWWGQLNTSAKGRPYSPEGIARATDAVLGLALGEDPAVDYLNRSTAQLAGQEPPPALMAVPPVDEGAGVPAHLLRKVTEFVAGVTPGTLAAAMVGGGAGGIAGRAIGAKVGGAAGRVAAGAVQGAGSMAGIGAAMGSENTTVDAALGGAFGVGGVIPQKAFRLAAEYGLFTAVESLQKGRVPGMEQGGVDAKLMAEDLLEPLLKMLALHASNPSALTRALAKPRAARTPLEAEMIANAEAGVQPSTAGQEMRQARLYQEGKAAGWPIVTDRQAPEPVERKRAGLLPKLLPAIAESKRAEGPAPILMGEPQVDTPATSRLRESGMEGQRGAEPGTTRPEPDIARQLEPSLAEGEIRPEVALAEGEIPKVEQAPSTKVEQLPEKPLEAPPAEEAPQPVQELPEIAAKPEAAAKEPWEMTRARYAASAAKSQSRGPMQKWYSGEQDRLWRRHERSVKAALAAGKPVPPEVLKDYPDLAAKAAEAPPSRETFLSSVKVDKVAKRQGESGEESFASVSHPEGGALEVRAEGAPHKAAKAWGVWDPVANAWLATKQTFAKAVKFARETLADRSGFLLIRGEKKEKAQGPVKSWQAEKAPLARWQQAQQIRQEMKGLPESEASEVIGMGLGIQGKPFKPAGPIRKAIQPLGSRIRRIDPELGRSYEDMEVRLAERVRDGQRLAVDYAKARAKVDDKGKAALKETLLTGLADGQRVADELGTGKEYSAVRAYLEDIHARAKAAGVPKLGYLENYWPRVVEKPTDLDAFLREKSPEAWGEIQASIAKEQDRLGRDLTSGEREGVITDFLLQYQPPAGSGRPGFAKERKIPWLTEAMQKFYKDEHESFARYVQTMETEIAKREWLGGKGSDPIAEVVDRLLADGKISDTQQKELRDLLRSRFALNHANAFTRGAKSAVYLGYIGQFKSTLTQLKDQAIAMYEAGLLDPRVRHMGAGYYGKALFARKGRITIDELAMRDIIAEEIGSEGWSEKSLRKTLSLTGFTRLDRFGKETMANAFANRISSEIKSGKLSAQTKYELERHLGKGYEKSAAYLKIKAGDREALARLSSKMVRSWHPVDKSGTVQPMLDHPSMLGLAYQLKTFQLRQLDAVRRETLEKIAAGHKAGDKRQVAEGFVSLARIGTLMMLAGATIDTVKDFLYGRPVQLDDKAWDNLLQIIGLSKFALYAARREGPAEAAFQQTIDPAVRKQATDAWMDGSRIVKNLRDGEPVTLEDVKSVKYLPGVGDWLYWHRIPESVPIIGGEQGRGRGMAQKQEGIQFNPLYRGDKPVASLERAKEMLTKSKRRAFSPEDEKRYGAYLDEALQGGAVDADRYMAMWRGFITNQAELAQEKQK